MLRCESVSTNARPALEGDERGGGSTPNRGGGAGGEAAGGEGPSSTLLGRGGRGRGSKEGGGGALRSQVRASLLLVDTLSHLSIENYQSTRVVNIANSSA